MADLTNNLIPPEVHGDIGKLIEELTEADMVMLKLIKDGAAFVINPATLQSLEQFNATMGKLNTSTEQLTEGTQQYQQKIAQTTQGLQNFGISITGNVADLVNQKQELKLVNDRLKELDPTLMKTQGEIVKLTARQLELKAAISANTKEINATAAATNNWGIQIGRAVINVDTLSTRIGYSILRFVSYSIVIGSAVAVIAGLKEAFTTLSEAEQIASDKLKTFTDNIKKFKADQADLSLKNIVDSEKQAEKDNLLISVLNNKKSTIAAVVNAYIALHAAHSDIIEPLTKEQEKHKESIKLNDEQVASIKKLVEARKLQAAVANRSANIDEAIAIQKDAEDKKKLLDKYMTSERAAEINRLAAMAGAAKLRSNDNGTIDERGMSKLTNGDKSYGEHINIETFARTYIGLQNEMSFAEQKRNDLRAKNQKDEEAYMNLTHLPKDKGNKNTDAKKEMEAELKLAKDLQEKRLQLAKENYGAEPQNEHDLLFTNKKLLQDAEIRIVAEGKQKELDILKKYSGLIGETEKQELARKAEIVNREDGLMVKAEETKIQIDEEIKKRLAEDDANSQKDIEKLRKNKDEISRLMEDLSLMKANDKLEERSSGSIWRALFGIGGNGSDIKQLRNNLTAAKDNVHRSAENLDFEKEQHGSKPNSDDLNKATKEALDDEIKQEQAAHELEMALNEKKIKGLQELKEKTIQLAEETFNAVVTIKDNQFAREQQQLSIKQNALQITNQQQIEAINATTNFSITKDNLLATQAAQNAAKQNELQQQQNQLALRKAKFDKQAAEEKIELDTSIGIMKIWAEYADVPVVAAALSAVTAAIGAAQYAAAASTPLPQFAEGTDATKFPLFIAGEAGEREYIKAPGKAGYWTTATAAVYNEPLGTSVTPESKMYEYAAASIGLPVGSVQPVNMAKDIAEELAKIIGAEFDEATGEFAYAVMKSAAIMQPKQDNGLVNYLRRQNNNTSNTFGK